MSGSAAAIAPDPAPAPPNLDDVFDAAGKEWNVDANLLRSVAGVESGGNVSTPDSKVGAQGLMQFMPGTAKAVGVEDPHDPVQAIFGAAKLLNENLNRYGNVEDALRAYNGGTDPAKWSNPETAAYPGKVAAIYGTLTGSQGGNAPSPRPYQVASADTGTMSDVLPPPDAPPRAGPAAGMDLTPHPDAPPADGIPTQEITTTAPAPVAVADASPAAGMDLAPHSAPGAPVDVTALPPADFFKLTTGGQAPAAANSNTPAAPPDVTAMSPADFFKATTAPAGGAPAKPFGDPYADQTDDLSMIGRGAVAEASHLANRVYSGANWVDQHAPWLGALDKAAGLDPGSAAATTNAYTGQNDQTYGGSGFYQGGKVGADLAAGLPLGEGIGLAGRGLAYASKSIPSVAGRIVQAGGNLLSGKTGATTLLGKTASSAGTNALQGGIIAGAYGDSPVQGAAWGAALGPAGEILAPAVGKVAGKIFDGGSGLVDRGLTALGAAKRPAAPAPEPPPTITQKWNGAPAQPAFPSAPAEPAPPPGSAAADRQALIEQAQNYSNGQNFTQSTAPREPMGVSSGTPNKLAPTPAPEDAAPTAEYTTTAPAPSAPAAPPVDAGGGRFEPSYAGNRLQADVPTERADPVIPPQGVTPATDDEVGALLDPVGAGAPPLAPRSMGAAASSRDASNPIPEMTPAAAKAQRSTYEQWRLAQQQPLGEDATEYIPGAKLTAADRAGDPEVSLRQEVVRQQKPGPFAAAAKDENDLLADHFDDLAKTPTITESLDSAREAQWQEDKAAAFAKKGKANPERTAGVIDDIASGPDGVDPIVRSKMKQLRDAIQTPDGELQTDPERLAGAYHMINRMLSKEGLRADPTSGMVKSQLMEVKAALAQDITDAAPGFRTMLDNYRRLSGPIDTQELLQDYKGGLTTAGKNMTFNKVNKMMSDLVEARGAKGINKAQSIDDDTMEKLWDLWSHLRRRDTNRALGSARGSPTSQFQNYTKKLGIGAVHAFLATHTGFVGNALFHGASDAIQESRLNKLSAKYLNPGSTAP